MKQHRTILLFAGLLLAVSMSVFIFFKTFFSFAESSLTVEILAAVLGTIITVIITGILLRSQTLTEQNREKSLGVFQYKLKLYSDFLAFVQDIIADDRLETQEISELIKRASLIALIAGGDATDEVSDFVRMCVKYRRFKYGDLTNEQRSSWRDYLREKRGFTEDMLAHYSYIEQYASVAATTGSLRADLGEAEVANEEGQWTAEANLIELVDDIRVLRTHSEHSERHTEEPVGAVHVSRGTAVAGPSGGFSSD